MSGIYIPNFEPSEEGYISGIYPDGTVVKPKNEEPFYEIYKAIPVPDHGDLIDKSGVDVLSWTDGEYGTDFEDGIRFVLDKLDELPVIIPADKEAV